MDLPGTIGNSTPLTKQTQEVRESVSQAGGEAPALASLWDLVVPAEKAGGMVVAYPELGASCSPRDSAFLCQSHSLCKAPVPVGWTWDWAACPGL